MRIILDENIPAALADWLPLHEVTNIRDAGWSGISNGELLEEIDGIFDLFITADKNLRYQQNLASRKIAILELPTNRLPALLVLREKFDFAVPKIKPGDYRFLV